MVKTKETLIVAVLIALAFLFTTEAFQDDDADLVPLEEDLIWAGHPFSVSSDGDTTFTDSGYELIGHGNNFKDDALATSTLKDINMNQKIKVKVTADISGTHVSGDWSEIVTYIKFGKERYGVALFGNRDRTCPLSARLKGECTTEGVKVRDTFSWTWFTIENDGVNIIFEDSSGRTFILNESTDTEHKFPSGDDEWYIGINSHVLGVGTTRLDIQKIEVVYG